FCHRAINISPFKEDHTEIVVWVGIIGSQRNGLLKMADCLIEPSLAREHVADATINERVAEVVMLMSAHMRMDGECALKVGKGVVQLVMVHKPIGEVRESHVIILGNSQRVFPECFAVAPVSVLFARARGQRDYNNSAGRSENFFPQAKRDRKICDQPSNRDVDASMRQVSVTISMTVQPDFNNSDHWKEHHKIPEPADQKIRPGPTQSVGSPRDANQQCTRERDLPQRKSVFRM